VSWSSRNATHKLSTYRTERVNIKQFNFLHTYNLLAFIGQFYYKMKDFMGLKAVTRSKKIYSPQIKIALLII
jgi:hypothetical protein